MQSNSPAEIAQKLSELRKEHRELDEKINGLAEELWNDQLSLRRMKKRKLQLKDWIEHLESLLIPDLDA